MQVSRCLIIAFIALAMCSCHKKLASSLTQSVTTHKVINDSIAHSSVSFDNAFDSVEIDFDSVEIVVEKFAFFDSLLSPIVERKSIKAKKLYVNKMSRNISVDSSMINKVSFTAVDSVGSADASTNSDTTVVAKPPDLTWVLIVSVALTFVAAYLVFKFKP